jgi:nucleoside-diphosphate-sugar epimerase
MRVVIAGGHGKIALLLTRRLTARGDEVVGLIRNPDHAGDVRAAGGEPVVRDLEAATEQDIARAVGSADQVVFAAGAGPGSGTARKLTMDRDGAIKMVEAAAEIGAERFLIVSSVGTESPPDGDDTFSVYLRAKADADAAVMASDRSWTVLRPGSLTDDPGNGRVRLSEEPFHGRVPRDDVAASIAALLVAPAAIGKVLYINGGDQPIDQALRDLA